MSRRLSFARPPHRWSKGGKSKQVNRKETTCKYARNNRKQRSESEKKTTTTTKDKRQNKETQKKCPVSFS